MSNKPYRFKRFRWNRNGTKSEEIIFLNQSGKDALEPIDFDSKPKTSSSYWFKEYPYEWYDIRRFWEIPSYHALHIFSKSITRDLNRNKIATTIMRSIMFFGEALILWGIGKFADYLFDSCAAI